MFKGSDRKGGGQRGQVYVVFNQIGNSKIASHIRVWFQKQSFSCHESRQQLEDIMIEFANDNIDILVATTIIESSSKSPKCQYTDNLRCRSIRACTALSVEGKGWKKQ